MKITAWKAKDGKIFENEKEYIRYETYDTIRRIVESAQFLNVRNITKSCDLGDIIQINNLDAFILDNIDSFVAMGVNIAEVRKSLK